MNMIKDFENAPVGATATHKTTGSRATTSGYSNTPRKQF